MLTAAQQAALHFDRDRQRRLATAVVLEFLRMPLAHDAANGAPAGGLNVRNGSGTYTFTLTDDAGGTFAIDGAALEKADTLVAGEKYTVTVEADNGVDDPISQSFQVRPT